MGPRQNTRTGRGTQALRQAILSPRLAPGTRLVERGMVDRLGESRTGVRAALQSLAAEGLVVRGNRRVFSVAVVSREEARQIYEVGAAFALLSSHRLRFREQGGAHRGDHLGSQPADAFAHSAGCMQWLAACSRADQQLGNQAQCPP